MESRELVRVFTGVVRAGAQDDFGRYLQEVVIPEMRTRPGWRSFDALADTEPVRDSDIFLVTTTWDGLASVKGYAHEDWTRPVLSDEEERMLESASVRHFHRVATAHAGPPSILMDARTRSAVIDGQPVELPPLEFRLLEVLYSRAGTPVTSAELAQALWPDSAYAHANDVRRLVYRLRRLLAYNKRALTIRTRAGVGYILEMR